MVNISEYDICKLEALIRDLYSNAHVREVDGKSYFMIPNNSDTVQTLRDFKDGIKRASEEIQLPKTGHPKFYEVIKEITELHEAKNAEYATVKDPLLNFKVGASLLSTSELEYCLFLMTKQFLAVTSIIREKKEPKVESLKSRLRDLATYSILAEIISEET